MRIPDLDILGGEGIVEKGVSDRAGGGGNGDGWFGPDGQVRGGNERM